jgi:2-enoate reductase
MRHTLVAPSDGIPNVWSPSVKHRGLTREEIAEYVDAYAKSALLCKEAGIDGVEIHAVHEGYLLDQFAVTGTNRRTDEYGGELENRLRFATDIIKAIKAACGRDYPVSVRYSAASKMRGFNQGALPGEDYVEFGRSLEESPAAARILEAAPRRYAQRGQRVLRFLVLGAPPVYMPMACNLPEVSYVKQFVKNTRRLRRAYERSGHAAQLWKQV